MSNADPACSETVVDGNERVVRARLDDAKFFYEEDLKVGLDEFVERLDRVVFHEKLGTMRQKVERMEAIAGAAAELAGLDEITSAQAIRAAHFAKADLVSQTVVEFTSQQGVMGGYFAQAAGEPEEVSRGIAEHYRPRFAGDDLPSGTVGKVVALADKLDTICGLFAVDEPPTGSSDPFAVRRSAIGAIAILQALPAFSLSSLVSCALEALSSQDISFDLDKVRNEVLAFFVGRLAAIARDEGVRPETIEAVSAVGVVDPAEFLHRAHALEQARKNDTELFDDLAHAYARAAHLADASLGDDVDETKFSAPELALLKACSEGEDAVNSALSTGDYQGALAALAGLREPIDRFFDEVLVMDEDEDVRNNRLRLLNRFAGVFGGVADMGALAGRR